MFLTVRFTQPTSDLALFIKLALLKNWISRGKDYILHLKNFKSRMKGSSFSIILLLEMENIR